MKKWMTLARCSSVIATVTAARGQSVGEMAAYKPDRFVGAARWGRRTPKTLQEERLRQLVGEMGMPGRFMRDRRSAADSSAIALPDITPDDSHDDRAEETFKLVADLAA